MPAIDEKQAALDRLGAHMEASLSAGEADNVVVMGAESEAKTSS